MLKGKLFILGFLIILLGFVTPTILLTTLPTDKLHTVTTNDVTVTTSPQTSLDITYSKEAQTTTLRIWTIQELNIEGEVVKTMDITKDNLKSHEITKHISPQEIVVTYHYPNVVSASGKPTTLKFTITPTANGIQIVGKLIDFAIDSKGCTFIMNYQQDGVGYQFAFDTYTFTMLSEFSTTKKAWFSIMDALLL